VRSVAEELAQDGSAPPGTEFDPAEPVAGVAAIPGRADGDVLDAVAIQIAGVDDHSCVLLARLLPRPVPELLSRDAGIDEQLPGERPRLVFRGRRRHRDVALAVAVEIRDRRHDPAEAAPAIRAFPVKELPAARR